MSTIPLLEEMLLELRRLNGRLEGIQSGVSSVEIKSSTRGQDVTVKVYAGSPIEPVGDAAMAEYARIVAQINQRVVESINELAA